MFCWLLLVVAVVLFFLKVFVLFIIALLIQLRVPLMLVVAGLSELI